MLTRLREIVEKVASAPRLNEALNILVTDICLAMDTEVCSVYLADHDRRCYYLMATRGLKKPRGRTVTLAFDEGIVGLVGRLAEPINLADAQKHPSFKYIPSVKERTFPRVFRRTNYSTSPVAWCTGGTATRAAPV
ncbi:phosphoenolpyruvate-protein phosphotransferase (PTS system, enzyme I) [Escherichia coli]|nr:phosphoenolpyruvate-protein phosphotransferase (PTS system, enzyme I) [Escherichia coli]